MVACFCHVSFLPVPTSLSKTSPSHRLSLRLPPMNGYLNGYMPSLTLGVPHSNYKPTYLSTTLAAPTFSRGLCHVCVASRYFSTNHRSLSCQRSPCPVFCVLPDYQSKSGAYFDKDRGISTHGLPDITLVALKLRSLPFTHSVCVASRYFH